MILKPWIAPKNNVKRKRIKAISTKLTCPFCLKSHKSLDSAHKCALEVSKYGSEQMKAKFQAFEAEWWRRHPELKVVAESLNQRRER